MNLRLLPLVILLRLHLVLLKLQMHNLLRHGFEPAVWLDRTQVVPREKWGSPSSSASYMAPVPTFRPPDILARTE